jgi:nucleoid-associated protein YgaU
MQPNLIDRVLSSLAEFFYHDAARWPEIANANQLTDPSVIIDGQRLIIP